MKLLRFRDWSLRVKVLVVLGIFSTLPLGLAVLISNWMSERARVRTAHFVLKSTAEDVQDKVRHFHEKHLNEAKRVTKWPNFVAYANTPAARRDPEKYIDKSTKRDFKTMTHVAMSVTKESYDAIYPGELLGVGILDPNGTVLASTGELRGARIGFEGFGHRYLKDAVDTKKPVISDLYYAAEVGDRPALAYAAPIMSAQEEVVALIVIWVKWDGIWRILEDAHDAIQEMDQNHEVHLCLCDKQGIRIAHTLKQFQFHPMAPLDKASLNTMIAEKRFGPEMSQRLREVISFPIGYERSIAKAPERNVFQDDSKSADGNVISFVAVPRRLETAEAPWTLFAAVRHDKLLALGRGAGSSDREWSFIVGMILLALLGPLAGFLIARVIIGSLGRLAGSIQKLAAGDFASRVSVEGNDELGAVGAGFNAMAETLQTTMRNLQRAIAAESASEGRLRAIMETVGDGIVTINKDGNIESFNRGATNILGYLPEEIVGQSIWKLLVQPADVAQDQPLAAILDAVLTQTATIQREVEGKHKDGRLVPIELSLGKVEIGDAQLYTASLHDLTARKHAEDEIRKAAEAAEEANRAKSQFLATMSHELRSPLTAIIGYTEILQEEAQDIDAKQMSSDLDKIHAQSKHLLTLINDVLDMSKIEAGKMDLYLETFELAKMIPDVASIVEPLMAKNANRLEVQAADNLGIMHADVTRLRQCLLNLLSNAAKFTDHGVITLVVTRDADKGQDWINFRVRDSGIGMTAEQMKRIFRPFSQADLSTTRKYGGTGLGLTITRKLCQMMGGDILLSSVPGEGSTFTLRLPAHVAKPSDQPAPEPVAAPTPELPAPGENTVLVVDDDPAVLDMLTRFLSKEGYQVVTASRGEDCIPLARKIKPRAITLDVMMPGVDGWTILSNLKADPVLAKIPVIILSIIDDKNLGFALGAADYLVKPLDRDRILEVIKKRSSEAASVALVAEDDPAAREVLRRHLEKDGWTVIEAVNGRQALECIADHKPSLILLDLMMPEMDGFEFIAEVSQHPEWRNIPVIVITAKDLTEEDRMFLNGSMLLGGCVKKLLQKGKFSRDELLSDVRAVVAKS